MDLYTLLASLLHTAPAEYHTPIKTLPLVVPLGTWMWGAR